MKLNDTDLATINGGSITATFLNYFATAVKTVYNIGQEVGGAIRRIATGKTCPL